MNFSFLSHVQTPRPASCPNDRRGGGAISSDVKRSELYANDSFPSNRIKGEVLVWAHIACMTSEKCLLYFNMKVCVEDNVLEMWDDSMNK